jgi:flagellar biosynthesis repressor protein FlbT
VALKIELKPNERLLLGDCVITNSDQRTRIVIEGALPIMREKDMMSLSQADTPAKCLYLALQCMYLSKNPRDNYTLYVEVAREIVRLAPGAKSLIDSINNRILTGDLYKALKEARKLIAFERDLPHMHPASKAYAKTAKETASPRELEAGLLLKAAAKLQAVKDSWTDEKPAGLDDALLYNRRLWIVFIDAVTREDNKLPKQVCENLAALGVRVMTETCVLMTSPQPDSLGKLIDINCGIAAGLRGRGKSGTDQPSSHVA